MFWYINVSYLVDCVGDDYLSGWAAQYRAVPDLRCKWGDIQFARGENTESEYGSAPQYGVGLGRFYCSRSKVGDLAVQKETDRRGYHPKKRERPSRVFNS
jgi:hypothetical protein